MKNLWIELSSYKDRFNKKTKWFKRKTNLLLNLDSK